MYTDPGKGEFSVCGSGHLMGTWMTEFDSSGMLVPGPRKTVKADSFVNVGYYLQANHHGSMHWLLIPAGYEGSVDVDPYHSEVSPIVLDYEDDSDRPTWSSKYRVISTTCGNSCWICPVQAYNSCS